MQADPMLIGAIMALVVALTELTKFIVSKLVPKKNGRGGLTPKEHDAVFGTYRILKEQILESQKETLKVCRDSLVTQNSMLESMRRMERKVSVAPPPRRSRS